MILSSSSLRKCLVSNYILEISTFGLAIKLARTLPQFEVSSVPTAGKMHASVVFNTCILLI